MERFAVILIAGAALTGGAQASSIVTLQPMKEAVGPSMVVLGAPELPDMAGQMGRSGPLLAYPFPGMRAPTIVNAAPEERSVFYAGRESMVGGWNGTFDKLAALLPSIKS